MGTSLRRPCPLGCLCDTRRTNLITTSLRVGCYTGCPNTAKFVFLSLCFTVVHLMAFVLCKTYKNFWYLRKMRCFTLEPKLYSLTHPVYGLTILMFDRCILHLLSCRFFLVRNIFSRPTKSKKSFVDVVNFCRHTLYFQPFKP